MMKTLRSLTALRNDQRGLSTMEYSVLFVLIVVGAIGLWTTLGQRLASNVSTGSDTFNTNLSNAQGGHPTTPAAP